jgi:hypothetical protein
MSRGGFVAFAISVVIAVVFFAALPNIIHVVSQNWAAMLEGAP